MKPSDLVKVTYPNGVSLFWEVAAVLLGEENTESVIELTPINQRQNPWGKTLCPASLLDVLRDSGTVTVYERPAPAALAGGGDAPAARARGEGRDG